MASSGVGVAIRPDLSRPLVDLTGIVVWALLVLFFFVGVPWLAHVTPPLWIQLLSIPPFLLVTVVFWWGGRRHYDRVRLFMDAISGRVTQAWVANRWGLCVRFDNDLLLEVTHGTVYRAGDRGLMFLRFLDKSGKRVAPDAVALDRLWRGKPRILDRGLDQNDPLTARVAAVLSKLAVSNAGLAISAFPKPSPYGDGQPRLVTWFLVRVRDWPSKGEAVVSVLDDIAGVLTEFESHHLPDALTLLR